jgi:hypothetical protein
MGGPKRHIQPERYVQFGLNTKKASREFSELFLEMQGEINEQSDFINGSLMRIGPITSRNTEEASRNILVYLSKKYGIRYPSPNIAWPQNAASSLMHYSYLTMSRNIPEGSIIVIVNINAENRVEGEMLLNELTVLFVNSTKYIIVDRRDLEEIKKEQLFQMSGEVDDASVVSIGHFLGADVVITGEIVGEGAMRRLILKALDVKTSQILAASSEKI